MKIDSIVSGSLSRSVLSRPSMPAWFQSTPQGHGATGASGPQGIERKRLLAAIIHVAKAAGRAEICVIAASFERATGHRLDPKEARDAIEYLSRDKAPSIQRIFTGASGPERRRLLRATVLAWSAHGQDSEASTRMTEQIVALLGYDQDAICKTLDGIWLRENARKGLRASCKLAGMTAHATYRLLRRTARITGGFLAPRARRLGTRLLTTIQR